MVQILHEDIVCRHWSDSTDSIDKARHFKFLEKINKEILYIVRAKAKVKAGQGVGIRGLLFSPCVQPNF